MPWKRAPEETHQSGLDLAGISCNFPVDSITNISSSGLCLMGGFAVGADLAAQDKIVEFGELASVCQKTHWFTLQSRGLFSNGCLL